ncbi:hypothetical protein DFJ58DRAFT_668491 [Suillus subalutaceus]|uniref:uncharacterized protein n=1 Tax=Suillus subalutaceus TaxID=48586 RepID=UPI001B874A67|nr:uncharacterized protein DFJ58DRAFT_668491 [Suillus subalutaceus]KAG1838187.1 hypothetical protein DFJ58DRAFT_668491 [Suillus subalutaceus]
MSFAKTRSENEEGVREYMDRRREDLLKGFVKDVNDFIDLLERTGTIISGSSALHLFQAKSAAIALRDMDIYGTHEFEEEVLKHFKEKEGYEVTLISERKTEYSSTIKKVYKMQKEMQKVDLIITEWASAIVPILQYHSTAVMNYMTARTFVSLYPKWTNDMKSLVNPRMYLGDTANIRTVTALMKYVRHGFRVTAEPFQLGIHDCLRSAYCPSTTRNTLDDNTLRWEFSKVKTVGNTTVACSDMAIVIWRLGGDDCEEDGNNDSATYIGVAA